MTDIKKQQVNVSYFALDCKIDQLQEKMSHIENLEDLKEFELELGEVLVDLDAKGKDRGWAKRKVDSLALAYALYTSQIGMLMDDGFTFKEATKMANEYAEYMWLYKKSDTVSRCGERLEFAKMEDGTIRLYRAFFCKDRLCSMCNWRRAIKLAAEIGEILKEMQRMEIKGRPIFITFTMKNVDGNSIGKSFSHFSESFHRLMKYKAVKSECIGAIRTSEITYNAKRNDYNTHIHCLLWMKPGYFKGVAYLSQEKWTELWKKAAKLDYTPIVNVKAVKPKEPTEKDPTGLFSAVLEVCKYPIKPDLFKPLFTKVYGESGIDEQERLRPIRMLEIGMRRKRLISFFGIFKEVRNKLFGEKSNGGIEPDEEEIDGSIEEIIEIRVYQFSDKSKQYHKINVYELTPELLEERRLEKQRKLQEKLEKLKKKKEEERNKPKKSFDDLLKEAEKNAKEQS